MAKIDFIENPESIAPAGIESVVVYGRTWTRTKESIAPAGIERFIEFNPHGDFTKNQSHLRVLKVREASGKKVDFVMNQSHLRVLKADGVLCPDYDCTESIAPAGIESLPGSRLATGIISNQSHLRVLKVCYLSPGQTTLTKNQSHLRVLKVSAGQFFDLGLYRINRTCGY